MSVKDVGLLHTLTPSAAMISGAKLSHAERWSVGSSSTLWDGAPGTPVTASHDKTSGKEYFILVDYFLFLTITYIFSSSSVSMSYRNPTSFPVKTSISAFKSRTMGLKINEWVRQQPINSMSNSDYLE